MKPRRLIVAVLVMFAFALPCVAQVRKVAPSAPSPAATARARTHVALPFDTQGDIDGVPYQIRVPANWNGTLLVYAHGYNETATPPYLVSQAADEAGLLGKGYALAASRFGGTVIMPYTPGTTMEAGWVYKDALQNIVDLTTAFRDIVGHPKRTIMWGRSMGGLITLGVIEKFPGLFDGAIALCPPAAGTPRVYDQKLDVTVAYAAAFGWEEAWGTPGALNPQLMDVDGQLYPTLYKHVMAQLTLTKKGQWEFLRRVIGIPDDPSFYGPTNFRVTTVYMAIMPRIDLDVRAGGHVAENVGRIYKLSDDDKEILRTTYHMTGDLDPDRLLEKMNGQAIYVSDRNARNYAEHYVEPTGRITRPVLTLHTTGDAVATPQNESAYRALVAGYGNEDLLVQEFTSGNGTVNIHCSFTSAQEIAAIEAMMHWLDTGTKPDDSFFPAAKLFVPGYVPPPWPWQ